MIDIIIPLYNCIDTLEKTLLSISNQDIKDKFTIILVDDKSTQDYHLIIKKFQNLLNIKYYRLDKNVGPGIARQYGIDHSKNQYIIFIDADDLFPKENSISMIYNIIKQGYDYVSSLVYNEYLKINISNSGDLHGKIYLRKFIEDNNIRFNNSRFHEDNLFNSLVLINNPKKININEVTYIYSYNQKSLTKKEESKEFDRLKIYIQNMKYVVDKTKDKCNKKLLDEYLTIKYSYLKSIYKEIDNNKRKQLNKWLKENNLKIINEIEQYN